MIPEWLHTLASERAQTEELLLAMDTVLAAYNYNAELELNIVSGELPISKMRLSKQDLQDIICDMQRDGLSVEEISIEVGRRPSTIRYYLREIAFSNK